MQKYLFYQQNPAILTFLTKCNFKNFMLWKWKLSIFEKQLFLSITFPFIDDFTLIIDEINDFWKFWPLMTFFGLHWPLWPLWPWMIFKAKTGLCWWKLSTIDLFSTIRCQNQSPNEIGHFESVWHSSKVDFLVWFLGKLKIPKRHFEINLPTGLQ